MTQLARIAVLLAALVVWAGAGLNAAFACTCEFQTRPPDGVDMKDGAGLQAYLLGKATDVVTERIVEVRAGGEASYRGKAWVRAKMNIVSVVKGDLPVGDANVWTGFGTGDCGVAQFFLVAIGWQKEVEIEVRKLPDNPGELYLDMCMYGRTLP